MQVRLKPCQGPRRLSSEVDNIFGAHENAGFRGFDSYPDGFFCFGFRT